MKTTVIYESMFGNTAQVARAVAEGLEDAEVLEVSEATNSDLASTDLLVLGGPTHAFSMTRPTTRKDAHQQGASYGDERRGLRELLAELPDALSAPVATFDTRIDKARRLPGSAAKAAAKELRRHHHAEVISHESFYVTDTEGPLLEGELARASMWGRQLRDTVASK